MWLISESYTILLLYDQFKPYDPHSMTNAGKLKSILLLDGAGAVLSAVMHGLVLVAYEKSFGMPASILRVLGFVALLFAIYSFSSAFFGGQKKALLLRGIAIANLLFCVVTSILIIYYFPQLTGLGLLYFVVEIMVVLVLVRYEFKFARQ